MKNESFAVQQNDGHITRVFSCLCEADPKGSLLILHGMAEHHERYLEFAHFLNQSGIDVYLYDHRGHGKDTKLEDLGYLAASKGYQKLIDDALAVAAAVREHKRSEAFFIFGHSMGSLVTRCLLQQDDQFTGAVICGTTHPDRITSSAGLTLSRIICSFKGVKHRSTFMNHLLFENKQYLKVCTRTVMDWLTRDNTCVGAYIHDPYCGFLCTASFYHDLIKLTALAGKSSHMLHTRKDLPLYFVAGDQDPVGGYGKQVQSLVRFYEKHGYSDINCKLYPEDRHEILNELDKATVSQDILDWIQKHC